MTMLDICPKQTWAALEDEIHRRFGLNARIYDDKGFSFTGNITWGNRICPAIKAKPQGVSGICSVAHTAMAAQAKVGRETVIEECDAGLTKICVPVFVGDEFVGVAGGCGKLAHGGEVDSFMVEKTAGLTEEEVAELTAGLPEFNESGAAEAAKFIEESVAGLVAAYLSGRRA